MTRKIGITAHRLASEVIAAAESEARQVAYQRDLVLHFLNRDPLNATAVLGRLYGERDDLPDSAYVEAAATLIVLRAQSAALKQGRNDMAATERCWGIK